MNTSLTLSHHLGTLEEDPDNIEAYEGVLEVVRSADPSRLGEDPRRLIKVARVEHLERLEVVAAVHLMQAEVECLVEPAKKIALLYELAQHYREDLLSDEKAKEIYKQILQIEPSDEHALQALEQVQQTEDNWKDIAARFEEEASQASDASLKASLLARAAVLFWQHKKKGKEKDTDKLFRKAIETDPSNVRVALLYERTLRAREQWNDIPELLIRAAEAVRNRDESASVFLRAARVLARRLEQRDRAAACYERVIETWPGHHEAMGFLVKFFTDQERWNDLVAVYETALRVKQKPESEQGILLQIAMVHWRLRNAQSDAEPYFARIRKTDPTNAAMLEFNRDLFQQTKDASKWISVLSDALRETTQPEAKLALATELARVAQESSAGNERAMDAWKIVLQLDPKHEEAAQALRALYAQAQKWNALAEIMRNELEHTANDAVDRRVALLFELVEVYKTHLKQDALLIQTYKSLLTLRPSDQTVIHSLMEAYEKAGKWNDLIQVLEQYAELAESTEEKISTWLRIASLWIECFANYNQATKPLERVIEVEPRHRPTLERLREIYTKKRAWKSLAHVLRGLAESEDDPMEQSNLWIQLARLSLEKLHEPAEAIVLWKRILELGKHRPEALDALQKATEKEKDWTTLVWVLKERQSDALDPQESIKLWQRIGSLSVEYLNDIPQAVAAGQEIVRLDPDNARARRSLRELYVKAKDWQALENLSAEHGEWEILVETLGGAVEDTNDPELQLTLSLRAAQVAEEQALDPKYKIKHYERVLAVQPDHKEAAQALVPLLEDAGKWDRVYALLETLLRLEDSSGGDSSHKIDLVERLRELASNRLQIPDAAFNYAQRAYELSNYQEDAQSALEAVATRYRKNQELLGIFVARLSQTQDESETRRLLERSSELAESLSSPDLAVANLEAWMRLSPDDPVPVERLERIHRAANNHTALHDVLLHRLDRTLEPSARRSLLGELAKLEESVLGDRASAVKHYREQVELDPRDVNAVEQLESVSRKAEAWEDLKYALERHREIAENDAQYSALSLELGALLIGHFKDSQAAFDVYADLLSQPEGVKHAAEPLKNLRENAVELRGPINEVLISAYEAERDYAALIEVLKSKVQYTEDVETRRELWRRMADIASEVFGDWNQAYESLEQALLENPNDDGIAEDLRIAANKAQRLEKLASTYERVLENEATDADTQLRLAKELTNLYEGALLQPEAAEGFHQKILSLDVTEERSFHALKELYTRSERWEDLQRLYRNRVAQVDDAVEQFQLLQQVGFLHEEVLDDLEASVRAYQEAYELDPTQLSVRRTLERLYTKTFRWRDLETLLLAEIENANSHELVDLRYRLGDLYEKGLREPNAALDQFEAVLEMQTTHLRAQEALERLLIDPSSRSRAATILEPIYEKQGAYPELVRVLESQLLDERDVGSSVYTLKRIADLMEHKLQRVPDAFSMIARAVGLDPEDTDLRSELARLSKATRQAKEYTQVLENVLGTASPSSSAQVEILRSIAELWDRPDGDYTLAERAYKRIVEVDPDNPEHALFAARALERIHRSAEAYDGLIEDLKLQIRLDSDVESQRAAFKSLALVFENFLNNDEEAITAYVRCTELDAMDVEALSALERLYQKARQWQKLIGVLHAKEQTTLDATEQSLISKRIATLYENEIGDSDSAIAAYNDILSRFGADVEALRSLARLYEKNAQWDDLIEVLESLIQETSSSEERILIQCHYGEVLRTHRGDVGGALQVYLDVLAQGQIHQRVLDGLEAIAQGAHGESSIRAAQELRLHYQSKGDGEGQIKALAVLAGSEDVEERLNAQRELATVCESSSHTLDAFSWISKAVFSAKEHPVLDETIKDLERLGEDLNHWDNVIEVLQKVGEEVTDEDVRVRIFRRIAELAQDKKNDLALAQTYYQRVLAERADDKENVDALEIVLEQRAQNAELAKLLKHKVELNLSDEERTETLLKLANVAEYKLRDTVLAIESLEQAAQVVVRVDVYARLERLYTEQTRWTDLIALYERQIDLQAQDPIELRYRLARVSLLQLNDADRAFDELDAIVSRGAEHPGTVEWLETLASSSTHQSRAADLLETTYLTKLDWTQAIRVMEQRVAAETDSEVRKKILLRLGEIHEAHEENLERAMDVYGRLFLEDTEDDRVRETFHRLARVLERWDIWAERISIWLKSVEINEPQLGTMAFELGRVYGEKLKQWEEAARWYEKAYRFDPADSGYAQAYESACVQLSSFEALYALLREQSRLANSLEQQINALTRAANLAENSLSRPKEAIELWREIGELEPSSMPAFEALERFYTQEANWTELLALFENKLGWVDADSAKARLFCDMGRLLYEHLARPTEALERWTNALQYEPNHAETLQALERAAEHPELYANVQEVLAPIYEQSQNWRGMIRLYELRAHQLSEPQEELALLKEVAALWQEKCQDEAEAFRVLRRTFVRFPEDEDTRVRLEQSAEGLQRWQELIAAYQEVLSANVQNNPAWQARYWMRLAELYDTKQGDVRAAISAYEQAASLTPDAEDTLNLLESLYTLIGEWSGMIRVLERRLARAKIAEEQGELWRTMGSVYADLAGDDTQAISAYEQALSVHPEDVASLVALDELYRTAQQHGDRAKILERLLALQGDSEEKSQLQDKLIDLYTQRLDQKERAIELYESRIAEQLLRVFEPLKHLYQEHDRFGDLRSLYERRLAEEPDVQLLPELRYELAIILRDKLGELEGALALLHENAMPSFAHAASMRLYETVLTQEKRWPELAVWFEHNMNLYEQEGNAQALRDYALKLAALYENELQRPQDALEVLWTRFCQTDPDIEIVKKALVLSRQCTDWPRIAASIERLLPALEPSEAAPLILELATIREEQFQDSLAAEAALRSALEAYPHEPRFKQALRALIERQGDMRKLIDLLHADVEALTTDAEKAQALVAISELEEQKLADVGAAVQSLEKALAFSPGERGWMLKLCKLHAEMGNPQAAIAILEKLVASYQGKRTKEAAQPMVELGRAYEQAGQVGKALETYESAFRLDLSNARMLWDLGRLAYQAQDWERAQKNLRALLLQKIEPSWGVHKTDVYYYLGETLLAQKDRAKAIPMFERAASESPGHPQAAARLQELRSG